MMIKVAIAVGLGIFALVAICCVSWGVWKIRRRMSKGQISATPDDIPVEDRDDAVLSLPTIKTSDLKIDGGAKLRCPLCWLDFRDEDVMRQLPQCDHIFHRHCIDRLLDKKMTCPVCSSVLTDHHSVKVVSGRSKAAYDLHVQDSPRTVSAHSRTPSWVLVNRPVPLPRTTRENSSSSSERFEIDLNLADSTGSRDGKSPLLKHVVSGSSHAEEWKDVDDLEKCIDISFTFGTEIPVEKRQHSRQSSMDSFSFEDAFAFETTARHSRRGSQSFKRGANWEFGHPVHLQEVSEEQTHVPLTSPPDECSFDVLPVVTRSGNHGLKSTSEEPMKVGSNRLGYSHL